jgi:recombinational DNA repair ATPase RecF
LKLAAVHLEGFRGATRRISVKFDPSKPVSVLFGENGTGKSSVVDAIDFACNQSFGSLVFKSLGVGEKTYNHIGSITNGSKIAPTVEIEFVGGGVSARLVKNRIEVTHNVAGGPRPVVSVLRRAQIARLIDAPPKDRFEELRSFFDAPAWTSGEAALRAAMTTKEKDLNQQATRLEQATRTLETLWKESGSLGGSAEAWAAAVLAAPAMGAAGAPLRELEDSLQGFGRACRVYRAAAACKRSSDLKLAETEQAAERAEAKHVGSSVALVKLLEDAKQYVSAHDTGEQCPVCLQGKPRQDLRSELERRLSDLAELGSAQSQVATQRAAAAKEAAALDVHQASLNESHANLLKVCAGTAVELTMRVGAQSVVDRLMSSELDETDLNSELTALGSQLEPVRLEVAAAEMAKSLRDEVDRQTRAVAEARKQGEELAAVTQRLNQWLNEVSAARKEVLDAELASMSDEVTALYGRIHEGEGKAAFNFAMRPAVVSSLEFDAEFLGYKGKPVQAYLSESHLDTLGLCVFLVVAKRKAAQASIVVLDDVLTSVDAAHLDRIMDLIDDFAASVSQVIIATHYRLWREKYRWARSPQARTEVIEFGPWSLTAGIQVQEFRDALTELRALIAKSGGDRQVIAAKAGIVLESVLDFLTLKYACALPRNPRGEYALGALADGIDKKLATVLRVEMSGAAGTKQSIELKPLIGAATSAQWVRNAVGCHFTALDSQIPDVEVSRFASAVLALADSIICQGCKSMPDKDKTGSNWQCRCGSVALWPLARPKD